MKHVLCFVCRTVSYERTQTLNVCDDVISAVLGTVRYLKRKP
jgi:hypothetical protein